MKRINKLAAAAAFITALVGTSTVATAAVPGNTVLVGDSIVANPTVADHALNKAIRRPIPEWAALPITQLPLR